MNSHANDCWASIFLKLVLGFLLAYGDVQAQMPREEEDAAAVGAALEQLEVGKMFEGLSMLRQVLRRNPKYADAYFYLGMIYTEMRQHGLALRYVQKAIELDPEKGAYYNQVSVILSQQGKFQEALKMFQKAAEGKLGKDQEKIWRNIGYMHQQLLHWDDAIRAFQKALEFQPQDTETHLALGKVYLDRNQPEEAIRELVAALQIEPDRAMTHTLLGMAYGRTGKLTQAVEAFRKATTLDPQDETALYNLAQHLTKLGQTEDGSKALEEFKKLQEKKQERERRGFVVGSTFQTAIKKVEEEKLQEATELLKQVLALEPHFVPALYTFGFALLKQEKYEQAIASLRQAVDVDPLNAGAYFYLGLAYTKTGNLTEALEATQCAVVIYEEDAKYHNQIGEIYLKLNQKEEAQQAFAQALKLDEKSFPARLNLGSLALQDGNLKAALDHLQVAVALNPLNAEARRLLGLAYLEDRQYDKSIEQYKEAVHLSPAEERLNLALAEALIQGREFGQAEQALKEALRANPSSGLARYNLGELYYTQGKLQEALSEFEKSLELKAGVGVDRVYRKIGAIYASQIKFEEAIAAYRKALEINPKLLEAHGAIGNVYLQRNLYSEALAAYQAALAIDPSKAEAHARIAQVYLRMGKYAEAVEASKKALELDSHHRSARYALANALIRLGRTAEGQEEMQKFQQMQTEAQEQEHHLRELVALSQEAIACMQQEQYEKAVALFRKATEYDPRVGLPYGNLALALIKIGKHEDAIENLQKAVQLNFDFPEVHRYLAEEYKVLGKIEDSEKEMALYLRMRAEQRKIKRGTPDQPRP